MILDLTIHADHCEFLFKVFATAVLCVGDVNSWQAQLRSELLMNADMIRLGLTNGDFPTFLLDQSEAWLAVYQGMHQLESIIQSIPDNTELSLLPFLGFGHWLNLNGMKESVKILKEAFLKSEYFPDLKSNWLKLLQQYPSMACHSCAGQRIQFNVEKSAFYGEDGSTFEWFDISYGEVADYLVDENHLVGFTFSKRNRTYSIRSQNLIF